MREPKPEPPRVWSVGELVREVRGVVETPLPAA